VNIFGKAQKQSIKKEWDECQQHWKSLAARCRGSKETDGFEILTQKTRSFWEMGKMRQNCGI
jgi:hypothetical protein